MWWGHPPAKPCPLGHKKLRFTPRYPQQRAKPGLEQRVVSALLPLGPPASPEGNMVTWESCEEKPQPGRSQGNHASLAPARLAMSPRHPRAAEIPPVPAAEGGPCFSSISGAEGPPG